MKFSGEFTVCAPREQVFERLNDPQFFASCLEGVSDLVEVDPENYTATLATRIAYIKFSFAVAVAVVERETPRKVIARVEGTPIGVVGRLTAVAEAEMDDAGDDTVVRYVMDVALAGKLGSIGQPVLRSKAREMERGFIAKVDAAFPREAA
jgi:uncharacterized protein